MTGTSTIFFGDFNPRTREGCDQDAREMEPHTVFISIHAPVKGATLIGPEAFVNAKGISIHAPVKGATCYDVMDYVVRVLISIHAPVKGATAAAFPASSPDVAFQSTHP